MLEISIYRNSRKVFDSSDKKEIEVKYNKMGRRMYSIAPVGLAFLNIDALAKGSLQLNLGIFKEVFPFLTNTMYLIFMGLVLGGAVATTIYCSTKKETEINLNSIIKNVFYVLIALSPCLLLAL